MAVVITNINITSNLLTVTTPAGSSTGNTSSPGNSFVAGELVTLQGLTTNTFLNSQQVTVLTSTGGTFTANFTHANVSTSDTGTATTTKAVRAQVKSAQLLSDYLTWAQGISNMLNNFGWVLDTGVNGTVNWATTIAPNVQGASPVANNGGYSSQGAWSNAHGAYTANVHYVTYTDPNTGSAATYLCSTGYTPTTASAPPPYDTTHWVVWNFEVWKSNNALTTIFMKFEYIWQGATGWSPQVRVYVATGRDTSGNMGTAANQQNSTFSMPVNNGASAEPGYGTNNYFSGDAGNRFTMILWAETYNDLGASFMTVERGLSSTGTYQSSPTYWSVHFFGYSNSSLSSTTLQTSPGVFVKNSDTNIWTLTCDLSMSGSAFPNLTTEPNAAGVGNMVIPLFPIWPIPGWVGNPITSAMTFKVGGTSETQGGDTPNAAFVSTVMYGQTRTYYCSHHVNFTGIALGADNGIAIRWD